MAKEFMKKPDIMGMDGVSVDMWNRTVTAFGNWVLVADVIDSTALKDRLRANARLLRYGNPAGRPGVIYFHGMNEFDPDVVRCLPSDAETLMRIYDGFPMMQVDAQALRLYMPWLKRIADWFGETH